MVSGNKWQHYNPSKLKQIHGNNSNTERCSQYSMIYFVEINLPLDTFNLQNYSNFNFYNDENNQMVIPLE